MKERILMTIIIVSWVLMIFFVWLSLDIINDKTAYINGLQSDKNICKGKLDSITQDYEKLVGEMNG